ncbi:MAG: AarF/ABC1/UbiB kinase family protein [Deltaproteobacteria bacterium]|nr:AarF/ABC1/UbiB kinase family protein [Deltaproteobacteria bacterium]
MAREPQEKVPGRLVRTIKAGILGGSVAGSYLGGKLLERLRGPEGAAGATENDLKRHLQNARKIVSTMKELRGPVMKVGQLLSTHAEALPGEYGEILRSLQASAPPMAYETIREVLRKDLGDDPEKLFKSFSRTALAAASLGQVHRATLPDGTDVAVKVQYPGADESVDGDLKNLKLGAGLVKTLIADLVRNDRLDFTPVAEEIAEHLAQETDYCREAYNANLLRKLFEPYPWMVIPKVHNAFSGLRVVTYDYVGGVDLGEALKDPDPKVRSRIVRQLSEAFWIQVLKGGVLHADPHPGNYRILPDGRFAMLDFGCVKVFEPSFLVPFADMVRAHMNQDEERFRDAMQTLGLLVNRNDPQELADMRRISEYFATGLREDRDFDFGEYSYVRGAKDLILYFLNARRIPPSQRDFIFLTRVVLGYYEYFSRAREKANFRRMVEPWVREGWQGRTIQIPPYGG